MYEIIDLMQATGVANKIFDFVFGFAKNIAPMNFGLEYSIDPSQVGFIVTLCVSLLGVCLYVLSVYLLIKALIFIVKGVINW